MIGTDNGSRDKTVRVVYSKQCHCRGTSSTGSPSLHRVFDYATQSWVWRASWGSGFVCDVCGKPWKLGEEKM